MKPEKIEELERLCEAATCPDCQGAGWVLGLCCERCQGRGHLGVDPSAVPELIREVRRLERQQAVAKAASGEMVAQQMRAEQAESESKRLSVALANVSGALVDAGTVDVPEDVTEYGKAVRGVVGERDRAMVVIDRLAGLTDEDLGKEAFEIEMREHAEMYEGEAIDEPPTTWEDEAEFNREDYRRHAVKLVKFAIGFDAIVNPAGEGD